MPRAPKKPSAAASAASPGEIVSADDSRLARGRAREGARFTAAPPLAHLPESYATTLEEIKRHLQQARVRAVLAANPIVIEAYWQTGRIILERQREQGWGAKVIDRLAADLQAGFPDMKGLTRRNLFSMRAFAEAFPNGPIVKQPVSQLPWGHLIRLIQMVKDPAARDLYIRETLTHGWSRSIMQLQIEQQLHRRLGHAQNNFPATLPPADSDLATQIFKDRLVVEYALRGLDQSIAVAAWQTQLTESLPEEFQGSLPTIAEIEAELAGGEVAAKPGKGGKP